DDRDHVEIELLEATAVEREVDRADLQRDAEFLEVQLPVGHPRALARRQVFDLERLAPGIAHLAVGRDLPAGLLEQRTRLQQIRAELLWLAMRARRNERRTEHFGRQLGPERLE